MLAPTSWFIVSCPVRWVERSGDEGQAPQRGLLDREVARALTARREQAFSDSIVLFGQGFRLTPESSAPGIGSLVPMVPGIVLSTHSPLVHDPHRRHSI